MMHTHAYMYHLCIAASQPEQYIIKVGLVGCSSIRVEEMEVSPPCLRLVSSLTLLALVFFLVHVCYTVLLKSERIKRKLRMQGIQGPPPSFLYGNLPEMQKIQLNTLKASSFQAPDFIAHDYTSTVFPYFEQWRKEYGIRISLLYLLLSSYL